MKKFVALLLSVSVAGLLSLGTTGCSNSPKTETKKTEEKKTTTTPEGGKKEETVKKEEKK